MNLCQAHWDRLCAAISARGLDSLVSKSGEEIHAKVTTELTQPDVDKRRTFDPLMGASFAIINNALSNTPAGLALLQPGEDGKPPCPLCYINKARHEAAQAARAAGQEWGRADDQAFYDGWIERAADDAREHAIRLGLMSQG